MNNQAGTTEKLSTWGKEEAWHPFCHACHAPYPAYAASAACAHVKRRAPLCCLSPPDLCPSVGIGAVFACVAAVADSGHPGGDDAAGAAATTRLYPKLSTAVPDLNFRQSLELVAKEPSFSSAAFF